MEGIDFEYRLGSCYTFSLKLIIRVNYITIKIRGLFLFLIISRQGMSCEGCVWIVLFVPHADCGIEIDR